MPNEDQIQTQTDETQQATAAAKTFVQKHGGFMAKVGWMFLGALIGAGVRAGINKYQSSSSNSGSVGSGE